MAYEFRIFFRTNTAAERTKIAITQWLKERLKLEVSQEKTRVVNVKRRYSEFLGFKIKVHSKGSKMIVKSYICDKQLQNNKNTLVAQIKRIARPQPEKGLLREIRQYNKIVVGIQNYYRIATNISLDAHNLNRAVMTKGGTETVHKLIHATNAKIIQKYLQICKPDMKKLNVLRKQVGNSILSVD